uniref:Zinc finger and BTB domain containing 16a n=1 Tax=Petromyzon marinus TaxID=7757 RepID=S4RDB1_PETMA
MNVSDTPVAIRLVNPSHPGAMLHRANQLRQAGTLCDVVIQVDGQQFPAHRAVLAAASKMFELLFGQRGDTTRYTLDFLSPRTFAQVLEYMYTSTLEVRPEDLDDLLYAAEILEIEYLEEQCLKLLEGLQGSEGNESEVTGELEAGRGREDPSGLYLRAPSHHALEMMAAMLGEQHRLTEAQAAGLQAGCFSLSPRRVAVDSLMSLRHSLVAGQHLGGSSQMETSGAVCLFVSPRPTLASLNAAPSANDGNQASVATRQESMEERQERSGSEVEEAPGTPTRGSVITSARDLHRHSSQDDPEDVVMRQPLDSDEEAMVSPPEVASNDIYSVNKTLRTTSAQDMPCDLFNNVATISVKGTFVEFSLYINVFSVMAFQAQELASRLGELYLPPGSSSAPGEEKCDICNVSFSSRESLWEHRKLHMEKGYACDLCGKRFLDSLRLRMHLLSHSANGQSYSCEQCGAAFTKESSLEHHREAHRESGMAYFCLLCGKRLQTQSSLLQHMEVHAGAHEYVCGECNRTFPSHSTLKRHLRSHTSGEHPYECEFCGSCFRDEASLKHQLETHYRVHTGEKPFECKLCHQRSRDYSAMIKHLRTHNGAAPYQCTLCLQFCSSLAGMQKHMKAHRPEDIPPDWRIEKTYLYLCYV